ncbi:MAG: hypothetical protein K1W36_19965 [Lachnospiraceae bacterium]
MPKSIYSVLSPKANDGGFLPAANTTLGERLTSDAYASEVKGVTFDKSNKTVAGGYAQKS